MLACVITKPGGPEVLALKQIAEPQAGPGQVRVRVCATAVNRADILQRSGLYPAPADSPADIPGLEFAGYVDQIGDQNGEFKVGERVFGLVGSGSYADYVVTNVRALARVPDNLSFVQAAAIPEAYVTAYDAIVTQAGLGTGEWLLISACGSGVGTAAIQIANLIGARAIGTARTEDKLQRARALGLEHPVLAKGKSWSDAVMKITGGAGVDCVLELVGGGYVAEDFKCMAKRSRLVLVGLLDGAQTELSLATLLQKRLHIMGTVLRSRPLEEKIAVHQTFIRHLLPHVASGRLKPVIDVVMPFADVAKAHSHVQDGKNFGKVILELVPEKN
jgi:putative PIG3 family NAD(P)H quinone oxidoreductase